MKNRKFLMVGPYHNFLLVSRDEFDYSDYSKLHNNPHALLVSDDIITYIGDTLKWIPCYVPARKKKMYEFKGLNLYGPTVIKQSGAAVANKIFGLWADLFAYSPKVLKLTGWYSWIEGENPDNGSYETIIVERDKITKQFRQLADYAAQVADSEDNLYILHLGI